MTNAALLARRQNAVPRGIATFAPVFADRAENGAIWDAEGRRFVDFASGIAVTNTGHRHPKVIAAAEAQMKRFTHTCFQVTAYDVYVELAERLNALAPIADAKSIFFTTGAEATENAVKIARAHTGRPGVITFTGAFHGRTMMTMAMTGKVAPYKTKFGPMPAGVYHCPFPIPHHGVSEAEALKALDFIFKSDCAPDQTAAIVIEPVQGEGGFYITPQGFMTRLREICDAHGIVLVADEVQSGFARTGKVFAIEHYGIEPDLIPVAKALGGGFPISGVIGKRAIMDAPDPGGLGGTYGGNPVSCAAALAVLDVIAEEGLCARADALGKRMLERIEGFKRANDSHPIGDVRGLGAMVAFEIVRERGGNDPDADTTKAVAAKALEHGLIVLTCGFYGNVLRLLPPLTMSDAQLDEGLALLESALKRAA
ncbi:MAG TPA: 4-aminobutyrate--2-oxoglutarate transaminase [Amaricoccus sp.]|uniref:4-aminobutyrate--2-oxoglutarate transaminase n=1 Tax=Amaricoccus sp. TaxID=1872485 RepID=UPI002C4A087C|nr:4-aminobutyrate--2-oxoglutarate transaminase [Amaricoccus sp.]HMQ93758.1 4-aminobutyrate--2-oxoglutarate transaminase [Amaricoccus sp.]HMR52957.1 4-aminobutyrate--2-oxoglutarate transaminase [Amaricoccus sp.]HMR59474.1 4-aminobutyrate--2-oxoglutarate transaminase [Amaricoccus sp.]HMT99852.1 4-aminobutyrate--2-oxoglutarate transaminase [Amaricoccus sp.]